jgi:hypothetical protein
MATMPAMVAARRPTHFPAEVGSLQEVNETRTTPRRKLTPSCRRSGRGRREAAAEGDGERSGTRGHGHRGRSRERVPLVATRAAVGPAPGSHA